MKRIYEKGLIVVCVVGDDESLMKSNLWQSYTKLIKNVFVVRGEWN